MLAAHHPCRPQLPLGTPPKTRFRHTATLVHVERGSLLELKLQAAVPDADELHAGHTILVFGGYNTMNDEFGGSDLLVIPGVCCSAAASALHWPSGFGAGG